MSTRQEKSRTAAETAPRPIELQKYSPTKAWRETLPDPARRRTAPPW